LYFDDSDLPALREAVKDGMRGRAGDFILRWGRRLLDPADPHYFDIRERRRDLWRRRESIQTWRASLEMLAHAYVISGDVRYADAVRDAVMITIRDGLADKSFDGTGAYGGWRRTSTHQHDKGAYAITLCTAFDFCHDRFSDEDRRVFADHAAESRELARQPLVRSTDVRFAINNRGSRALVGVEGFYALTLEGDAPRFGGELEVPTFAAAETYLATAFDGDGYPLEGWGYHTLGLFALYFLALARSGREDLRGLEVFRRNLHALAYEVLPAGRTCNNLNDCEEECGSAGPFVGIMSEPAGALVPWLLERLDLHPQRWQRAQEDLGYAFYQSPWLTVALFWDESVPLRSPRELGYPSSRCFVEAGVAALRTGWGEHDLLLVHRCGRGFAAMHRQSDQNHLALYALGEPFLVDEGYGRDLSGRAELADLPPRYFGRTEVHNTVMIDGQSQHNTLVDMGFSSARLLQCQLHREWATTLGDARGAYGQWRVIQRALRRVILIKRPQPVVLVIDDVLVDRDEASHLYEALWRSAAGNHIEARDDRFLIYGQRHLLHGQVLFSASPASLEVRQQVLLPQLRVKVRAGRLLMVTALCPTPAQVAPLRCTCRRISDSEFAIEVVDGNKVRWSLLAGTAMRPGPWSRPSPVLCRRSRS
jgi:hypothetical protein